MPYININGKITDADSYSIITKNNAFKYGYGLYETMLVKNRSIKLFEFHWERLLNGLDILKISLPSYFNKQKIENDILSLVDKNKLSILCRVRLQIFNTGDGIFTSFDNHTGILIECFTLEGTIIKLNENGLQIGIAEGLFKANDSLSNLKTCNSLIYAMAAKYAKINKWNDALILNSKGNIIESVIANIFWVKDKQIFTPPLSEGCIAGVMRRYIIENMPNVIEKQLLKEELVAADEIFLTNAIKGIKYVSNFENIIYNSQIGKKIYNEIVYKLYC